MTRLNAETLCQQQFEDVSNPGLQDVFVHASDADDYCFGFFAFGTGVLNVTENDSAPLTVLDIGAGEGTFLAEAKHQYGDGLRAIGITAVKHFPEQQGVEYIYGDIQRAATWQPQDTVKAGSVDIAVSSLTFQHLVDPLAALRNTFSLLKPDGHLFADYIPLPLHPDAAKETTAILGARLRAAAGTYGSTCDVKPLRASHSSLIASESMACLEIGGHIRNISDDLFDGIETHVIDAPDPIVVYSLASVAKQSYN